MANNTIPDQHRDDENMEDLYAAPTEAEIAAMLRAIAPARQRLYRKRLMRKAGKGLMTAACVIFLAKAADNATQQPAQLPVSDGIAQTTPIVVPAGKQDSSVIPAPQEATAVVTYGDHRRRTIALHKAVPKQPAANASPTTEMAVVVNQPYSADIYGGKPVDLPSNTAPVTGERTFAAAPGLPPVVLATPNK